MVVIQKNDVPSVELLCNCIIIHIIVATIHFLWFNVYNGITDGTVCIRAQSMRMCQHNYAVLFFPNHLDPTEYSPWLLPCDL